jgi:O-acetyl-ADP-ribose deacetylase (regulator of RNase III)
MKKIYTLSIVAALALSAPKAQAWSLRDFACWLVGNQQKEVCRTTINGLTIEVRKGDITKIKDADALVNAANPDLAQGGGLCGAIFMAAGPELAKEIQDRKRNGTLPMTVPAGDAVITKAYNLPARYLIHAVGPNFSTNPQAPLSLVGDAYIKSLALAATKSCGSIALPPLSAGIYRGDKTLDELALETFTRIKKYVLLQPVIKAAGAPVVTQIIVVAYSDAEFVAYKKAFNEVFSTQAAQN